MTTSRVHAKFILCGEHFVVHGGKCVAMPASCFSTRVTLNHVEDLKKGPRVACAFEDNVPASEDEIQQYQTLVTKLLKSLCGMTFTPEKELESLDCRVVSSIPPGQGAGSSSALACALVDAFLEFIGKQEIGRAYRDFYSQQLENTWHGPVSGVDNIAVSRACPIVFQRGEEPLQFVPDFDVSPLYFVVGSTGKRMNADNAFKSLREFKKNEPEWLDHLVQKSNEICDIVMQAMSRGDARTIGDQFIRAQALLEQIGASTHDIVLAIRAARQAGAYGAKLTGAGCGGFVLAIVPENRIQRVTSAWERLGLTSIRSIVCAPL